MKEEIAAAVFFVARLVKRYGCVDNEGREGFAAALTSALFEDYKNHWHPNAPTKGQAYSAVRYQDLGLPEEMTVWVDPGEVSCRYGEQGTPFCVSVVDSCRRMDKEFSRRIHDAVERASLDIHSGSSSDEEDCSKNNSMSSNQSSLSSISIPTINPEPKSIPTVSNPNSVYRFSEFAPAAPQTWLREKRKAFAGDVFPPLPPPAGGPPSQFPNQKGFKNHRATFTFAGPRVDKYHWVSKSR
ncbi:hypothetical protein F7725_006440 [Dissostichus mawsoni]|uniref:Anti-proliferative protein domain-containing protein n=1 Tax=Dissostichus mawsoni TaxID=36200 RepID=A0A7J5XWS2_DISMA|nr:hypothetical protein F7725_006440 [Dissostichus mawsoni]